MILKLIQVAQSVLRERAKKKRRSPHWDETQRAFLKRHPTCAACGGNVRLQVHHIEPYSNKPERELDPLNLITMCMSLKDMCHLRIAHGGDFRFYNPNVMKHAADVLARPMFRKDIEKKAKDTRLD